MSVKLRFINLFKTKSGGLGFVRAKTFTDNKGAKLIQLKASIKGKSVGESEVYIGPKRKSMAVILESFVDEGHRRVGVSSGLFKASLIKSKEHGAGIISADGGIIHPAQAIIRSKYKTKFFSKSKEIEAPSSWRNISSKNAIKTLVDKSKDRDMVRAFTKIPDDIEGAPGKAVGGAKIRFTRIRGRIVPIRQKT